jgi:hypothetical protein
MRLLYLFAVAKFTQGIRLLAQPRVPMLCAKYAKSRWDAANLKRLQDGFGKSGRVELSVTSGLSNIYLCCIGVFDR